MLCGATQRWGTILFDRIACVPSGVACGHHGRVLGWACVFVHGGRLRALPGSVQQWIGGLIR
jgi:hypothetical protein